MARGILEGGKGVSVLWIVAFGVLATCVLLTSVVLLGTLRRINGVLEQAEARLADMPATRGPGGLEPGSLLPAFAVQRFRGGVVTDGDLRGSPAVLLFLSSSCPACSALIRDLKRDAAGIPVPVYIVAKDERDVNSLGLEELANVLIQPNHELAIAFRTSTTPHAFAIDRTGTIIAADTPNRLGQLRELVRPVLREGGDAKDERLLDVLHA
jgi:AhpC/TSA family